MIDTRELILERMLALLATVPGIVRAHRNRADLPPSEETPGLILLDGSEQLFTNVKGKNLTEYVSAYFTMQPQVFLVLRPRDTVSNDTLDQISAPVGPELNSFRMRVLNAILLDETLVALAGTGGQIELRKCETDMMSGSTIGSLGAQMLLQFAITYPLRSEDL